MTIRQQAKARGHEPVGRLKRIEDDVYMDRGKEIRHKMYVDSEGTEYGVDWKNNLVYICGEDWIA